MARELRRLLIDPARLAPELALRPEEIRYLTRVLRYGPGDRVELTDGAGRLWSAALIGTDRLGLEQPLERPLGREPRPAQRLELAIAVPKRDMDLLVRMACELGVDRLQPLQASHSALVGSPREQRLEAILREASEQCERLWLPELAPTEPAGPWLGSGQRRCPAPAGHHPSAGVAAAGRGSPWAGPTASRQPHPGLRAGRRLE